MTSNSIETKHPSLRPSCSQTHLLTGGEDAYRRIWKTVRDIPYGQVASYGRVAELAGLPRRARLIGYALRRAPAKMNLPWHRVINAQGRISFPMGSEPYQRQLDRLRKEGVIFTHGKLDMQKFEWRPSLDELLWKP